MFSFIVHRARRNYQYKNQGRTFCDFNFGGKIAEYGSADRDEGAKLKAFCISVAIVRKKFPGIEMRGRSLRRFAFWEAFTANAAKAKSGKSRAPHLCLAKVFGINATKVKPDKSYAPHLCLAKAFGINATKVKKKKSNAPQFCFFALSLQKLYNETNFCSENGRI